MFESDDMVRDAKSSTGGEVKLKESRTCSTYQGAKLHYLITGETG
jgi:hypothetical protein